MNRQTFVLAAAILSLIVAAVSSALPAGATRVHAVDPAKIDPNRLALSLAALPSGAVTDHSAVSDNSDADTSATHQLHNELFEAWHRITGYRMDYHYILGGTSVQAGFLASIFPTPSDAQAAFDNATDSNSIIAFIGQPLPDPCPIQGCKGFSGLDPLDATKVALTAIYTDGPILIEASAAVPGAVFDQVKKQMEDQVYAVATAEEVQVKSVLSDSSSGTAIVSPTAPRSGATNTPIPPTSTPTPKPTPKPACKQGQHRVHGKCACRKGYKLVHGKCKKVKKQ